jgi:hypothetical protein
MTRSSWQKGKREWGGNYIEASYSGAGVFNATDGGALSMVMKNFHPGVY